MDDRQPADPTEPLNIPPRPPLPDAVTAPIVGQGASERAAPVEPEATTLPLPVVPPQTMAQPGHAPAAPAPVPPRPKRRRRGLRVAVGLSITVVVLAVLAGVGWFAGNAWAKNLVIDQVTSRTQEALGVASDHPVDVQVTEPMLPQLITGALDELTVTVPDAPLGKTTGTVTVHATGVPVSGDAPARSVDASVKLAPDAKLAGDLGRTVPGSLKVDGGNVVVQLDPSQFLSGVSFGLTLKPSAKDGQLVLTPVAFDVGGASMSADTIRARFGSLADGILAPRRVCVASAFPSGLTLSKIAVDSAAVTADFAVDPRILSDPALQKPGKCP